MTRKKLAELKEIVSRVPEDRQAIASRLSEELRFMGDTLEELKKKVKEYGTVELYENGKQKFLRENPAVKSYNTMIQRYATLYKQLTDLLPKGTATAAGNDLLEFMNTGE